MTTARRATLWRALALVAVGMLCAGVFAAWLAPANLASWIALASLCG